MIMVLPTFSLVNWLFDQDEEKSIESSQEVLTEKDSGMYRMN
jgi:hypothetical protein